jgi:hypothetical protein
MTGANDKDIAIFSTIAAESARGFIESRRQSALVRVKVDVAQNVVKALGALDDAIAVAKTALAAAAI